MRASDPLGNLRDYTYDPNGNLASDRLVPGGAVPDQAPHYRHWQRPTWDT